MKRKEKKSDRIKMLNEYGLCYMEKNHNICSKRKQFSNEKSLKLFFFRVFVLHFSGSLSFAL